MFYAHSTTNSDRHDWQGLASHLSAVAGLAEAFGAPLGVGRAARLAGLLHDVGKYSSAFQARLDGDSAQVDHSTAGAALVGGFATSGDDRWVAELVAYTIAGHHAGLPDKIGGASSLEQRQRSFDFSVLDPAWRQEVAPDSSNLWRQLDTDATRLPFSLALMGRMIFSCLVDADYRDTEAFYDRVEGRSRDRDWPALQPVLARLISTLESYLSGLAETDTKVNRLRAEVLAQVRSRASDDRGLFTLTVPTGGGKTLASLAFALDHAQQHGLERVIYAIPFTSIIDQTAAIFGDVLGAENVLEHHSAIDEETMPKDGRQERDKLKLAMEDWAAPIVVTTNVQLFESLFAARPSRARKLHNIANSVIILDEAQTLPRPLLAPCVRMIDELARNWGCSIVLCTATQPALDERHFGAGSPLKVLKLEGRELAPDPSGLARKLRRVTIWHRAGAMDNEALVAALGDVPQGLVIVNSRRHALDLFRTGEAAGLDGLIHLTTRQYAAHRRQILAGVRQRLRNGLACRVVATSLVEAGVDLDFPRVWRAEAGLDQIAQAAGRCNREGLRPVEDSIVTVFSAPDYPPPPEIRGLTGDMARMADKVDDLLSPEAMDRFFREVYWRLDADVDRKKILERFKADIAGTNFAYRTVAEDFRMIESGLVPVIVEGDVKAEAAIKKLGFEAISSGALARELQNYTVQVPPKARNLLIANGHVRYTAPELRGDQFAVLQTHSLYEPEVGLVWEDVGYLGLENSIL